MRGAAAHDFREQPECQLEMQAGYFLALVDLDSYPAFVAKNADRFDLIQHLCAQRDALTATFWEVPPTPLRLQILWAPNEGLNNSLIRGGPPLATGVVRTSGSLVLINDEELLAKSRQPHSLADSRSGNAFRQLVVAPGVYSISVFSGSAWPCQTKKQTVGYSAVLRHNPHPRPRAHPLRLSGSESFGNFLNETGYISVAQSHKAPN